MILVVLAFNADRDGNGQMRRGRLAKQATVPMESLEKALKLLESRGAIEYRGLKPARNGGSRSFGYRVLVPDEYQPHREVMANAQSLP